MVSVDVSSSGMRAVVPLYLVRGGVPIDYRIDPQTGTIYTTCRGFVTLPEVLAHFDTLERDPLCPARLDVLLDLTPITSFPESDQIRAVAERVGRVNRV